MTSSEISHVKPLNIHHHARLPRHHQQCIASRVHGVIAILVVSYRCSSQVNWNEEAALQRTKQEEEEEEGMRDLAGEEILRFHGHYVDPSGEYEIETSFAKNTKNRIPLEIVYGGPANAGDDGWAPPNDDGWTGPNAVPKDDDELIFYVRIIFSLVFVVVIVWLAGSWIKPSTAEASAEKPESKGTGNKEASGCSVETSKAGHRVQNLCSKFDQVKDGQDNEKKDLEPSNEELLTRSPVEERQYEPMDCTNEEMLVPPMSSARGKHPNLRHRRVPQTTISARSPSPPSLEDESDVPPRTGANCQSPTKMVSKTDSMQSFPSTPPRSVAASDASMDAIIQLSQAGQTPQHMVQEYCHHHGIIQQELIKANIVGEDSFRVATDLALMHQSSLVKERHLQKEMSFELQRQSSKAIDKYDDMLKELSGCRKDCENCIGNAISYSILVCLLLEAFRYAQSIMSMLEYFEKYDFLESVLKMACDCGETADISPPSFTAGSYILPLWSPGLIQALADYGPCVASYVLTLFALSVLHGVLRYLYSPGLLHQVLNAATLVLSAASQPRIWMIVEEKFKKYVFLVVCLGLITVASFACTNQWNWRTQTYISERQRQLRKTAGDASTPCKARTMLGRLENMARIFQIGTPMLFGMIALFWD